MLSRSSSTGFDTDVAALLHASGDVPPAVFAAMRADDPDDIFGVRPRFLHPPHPADLNLAKLAQGGVAVRDILRANGVVQDAGDCVPVARLRDVYLCSGAIGGDNTIDTLMAADGVALETFRTTFAHNKKCRRPFRIAALKRPPSPHRSSRLLALTFLLHLLLLSWQRRAPKA